MKGQIITAVTSYLADLSTQLTHLVKTENLDLLSDKLSANDHIPLNPIYKKLPHCNYLQYFTYLLQLDSTPPIRLENNKQPFTLNEDLQILKAVSSNPNKIILKSLEELASNKNVYKSNYRNLLVKRNFKQLKQRYQFLSATLKQPQLKYLTQWLQLNGLQTKAYLEPSTQEQFSCTGLKVKLSKQHSPDKNYILKAIKGKRLNPLKPTQSNNVDFELENLIDQHASKKKLHTQQQLIGSTFDINRVFQTPPVKIISESEPPQAPKKIKEEDSSQEFQKITPKKQRKIFRVLGVKKDVIVKEESEDQNPSRSQTQPSPKISEFKLFPDHKQQNICITKNTHMDKQKGEQNLNELQAIVQKFKTNQNMSEVRILKILDEVSGDLADLKIFLKTENRKLLWKRLEDAVLRNYIKNLGKRVSISGQRQLAVEVLYEKLISEKGKERVVRRIRYLKLEENKS